MSVHIIKATETISSEGETIVRKTEVISCGPSKEDEEYMKQLEAKYRKGPRGYRSLVDNDYLESDELDDSEIEAHHRFILRRGNRVYKFGD